MKITIDRKLRDKMKNSTKKMVQQQQSKKLKQCIRVHIHYIIAYMQLDFCVQLIGDGKFVVLEMHSDSRS